MALFIQPLYMLLLSFSDTTLLLSTFAMSLNFFHLHLLLTVTAFCTPHPERKTSPKYKNFTTFSMASPSSFTFSSTLVLTVKPESYNWFCLINKLG